MKLLLLSDIHADLAFLLQIIPSLQEADLVIISGDITNFNEIAKARSVIDSIAAFNPHILAVSGNCDLNPVDIYLKDRNLGLHAQCIQTGGIDFVGISGSLPCPGSTPSDLGESRFVSYLEKALAQRKPGKRPLVLVSHHPAYGTHLDQVSHGAHAGSTALRDFIDREHPLLAISGHIHEAVGIDRLGNCTLVNPGPFKMGNYALAEIEGDQVSIRMQQAV